MHLIIIYFIIAVHFGRKQLFHNKFHLIIISLSKGYHRQFFVSSMLPILLTGRIRPSKLYSFRIESDEG